MSTAELLDDALAHHRAGRLAQAAEIYRQALALAPDDPDATHLLGVVAFQQGNDSEGATLIGRAIGLNPAKPEYHHDLGDVFRAQGRGNEAVESYREAIALKHDLHESHVNLAALLAQQGRLVEAAAHYERALTLQPGAPDIHYNAGNALRDLGEIDAAATHYRNAFALQPKHWPALFKLAHVLQAKGAVVEAAAAYRRVLALEPNFAAAHFNLAGLNEAEGRADEAIAGYRAALDAFPESVDAHNNLANLLASRGRADEAFEGYARALALRPDFAEAHANLGNLLLAIGRYDEGVASLRRALSLQPLPAFKAGLARALAAYPYTRADADLRPLVLQAISEPWARPADLARAAASLLRADPLLGPCIARAAATPQAASLETLFSPVGVGAATGDTLLAALLTSAPVGDVAIERLLTQARAALWNVDAAEATGDTTTFAALLARQCHLNDYVFATSSAEDAHADTAMAEIADALAAGHDVAAFALARLACYVPLAALPRKERLLEREWPREMSALMVQVVAEPLEEATLAASLPLLTAIDDATSRRVRQQYEEHPYPRWVRAAPVEAARSFDAWLHAQFPGATFQPLRDAAGAVDLLIAGCGTGQHVVETARRFPRARIVALDLSRTSLAYATRKAREVGIANVEFAQGDLLGLAATGKTFDVIEAAGVLHHLAEPGAGWRSLAAALRPGGFMLAAIYGERARDVIVAGRDYATAHGYASTASDIRRFRQDALSAPADSQLSRLASYRDFHSTSECRDMLFHVEEHRTTLPAIKARLTDLGLRFVGFQVPPAIAAEYARRRPDDVARTNLDAWHAFETAVPAAFAGMYEFWVQRPALP
ncbi:MAG: tetratricopeptide repeat protein [Betaproteobacteria bacterium]